MIKKTFPEERLVLGLASEMYQTRYATPEEDHGYQKADVVITHNNQEYFLQVSRGQKSKREREKLLKRGTYPIHTHTFEGSFRREELRKELGVIVSN